MNTAITSKEAILSGCRKLVSENGLSSLNMRAVADACGVALGSLYYYFPSKDDLLIATIESVWEDIFRRRQCYEDGIPFPDYIERLFGHIQSGMAKYPNFFTIHSLSVSSKGRGPAQDTMRRYLDLIKDNMLKSLRGDKRVSPDAFSGVLSEEEFINFILSGIICLMVQKKDNCHILLEIIRRSIYP